VFDAVSRAWIVLVTVAFAAGAKLRPPGFWPLALRACLYWPPPRDVLVARSKAGPALWTEVQWERRRGTPAASSIRGRWSPRPACTRPSSPVVRLLAAWPLWLVVESLVGLALAGAGHALIARTPLSAAGLNH